VPAQRSDGLDTLQSLLTRYHRALGQEEHVLLDEPALVFQQMHNRLQWEAETVEPWLGPERSRRAVAGARPWLRTRTRFRESSALIRTLSGHKGWVHDCAFSPDGSRIVSASGDKTLKIWRLPGGVEEFTLAGHEWSVTACAFSPDGSRILSGGLDETLRIWDAVTGVQQVTLSTCGEVRACAFSPDGSRIVSGNQWGRLTVWDVATGTVIAELSGHTGPVRACAFSPDAQSIVSASDDYSLKVWNVGAATELATLVGHSFWVGGCAFSPDGSRVLSAGDETLRFWDPVTGVEQETFEVGPVSGCAFDPDGSRIASTGSQSDQTVRLWDAVTGSPLAVLVGHTNYVNACRFSPDGALVASASADGTVKVWDAAPVEMQVRQGHTGEVRACAFSPDGSRVVSAGQDGTLRFWNGETGAEEQAFASHDHGVLACAVDAQGSRIASVGLDGTLRLWHRDGGLQATIAVDAVSACAFSPDGSLVLSASRQFDGPLQVWRAAATAPELLAEVARADYVTACRFSPDGGRVTVSGQDGSLRVWRLSDRVELVSVRHPGSLQDCAFSPEGSQIVSASYDQTVQVWEASTGASLATLRGHAGPVLACSFSPDGFHVMSVSHDRTLRVWDVMTREEQARLPLPGALTSLAVHPWLPRIACGDEVGALHVVDLVGVEYGPIVVTATERAGQLTARCPACGYEERWDQGELGCVVSCRTAGCNLDLRINPFVLRIGTSFH
jgi:WD40 repeat protein